MKEWWRRVRPGFLGGLIYSVARAIGLSLRLKVIGFEPYEGQEHAQIFCGWHGRSMIPANWLKGRGTWAIISNSRDGEMQTRIFKKFGFQVIRGSSGKGGERALVEAIRELKKGAEMAITPDGPRGPAGVVQGGVLLMSKKSGTWLVPVASSAKPCVRVKSWDRYMLPLPFARAVFVLGDPIVAPPDASDVELEEVRLKLESEIHRLQEEADRMVGHGQYLGC